MQRLFLILVFGLSLSGVSSTASADGAKSGLQVGRGDRYAEHLDRHRPRRHRRHRGTRIEAVPELDPTSAAVCLMLLLGSAILVDERRRLRVVLPSSAA